MGIQTEVENKKQNKIETSERNVGIDLIKILAILMVVMSHVIPYMQGSDAASYLDITSPENVQEFELVFIRNLGQIGNAIFIISSAWFLCDSKKFRPQKLLSIEFDQFVISVAILVIFLILQVHVGTKLFVASFFPTLSGNNWFLPCYMLYFLLHPLMNAVLHTLDQKTHLIVALLMLVICTLGLVFSLYYTRLVGFVCIYFVTSYVKYYMPNFRSRRSLNITVSVACIGGGVFISVALGMAVGNALALNEFINPFFLFGAMGIFNVFSSLPIKEKKVISYLSSLTLLVYIIHQNILVRNITRPQIFAFIQERFTYQHIVAWSLLLALGFFVASYLCAVVYDKALKKPKAFICDKTWNLLSRAGNWIIRIFMRLN